MTGVSWVTSLFGCENSRV